MAPNNYNWINRILRFVTKEEVKTPLSFLFKVVTYSVAALIIVLYAPVSDKLKLIIYAIVFGGFLGLSLLVLIFAWWRPKHLVYGETGHRAEHKIEYGTEVKQLTRHELDALPVGSDPNLPRLEHEQK